MNIKLVTILHLKLHAVLAKLNTTKARGEGKTNSFGGISRLHTRALEQEANRAETLALTLTEGSHELLELCGALDLEENLVVIVRDFDVEVLGVCGGLRGLGGGGA